jgi:uncharacterized protein YutE (UPF0331/DUF86 family)
MSVLDLPRLFRKLSGMSRRIDLLKRYESISLVEYCENEETQMIVERLLELIIQAALDINKILLRQAIGIELKAPNGEALTNREIFILIGTHNVISPDLADQLARSGQFRNVLAHLYDDIDPRQVYDALQNTLEQYPLYIEAIQDYVDSANFNDSIT